MRLEKAKNTKRGIVYGVANKVATLVLPFFVQTVTIRTLGIEYVGIKGLFSSILAVLSLSELGIGTAIVYNMYKPIAENDIDTIGALLKLYKKLYRIIGAVVLCFGLAITPFLKLFIKGDYPSEINLQYVFLLYLTNTVLSYWLFAYKSSLLSAYQRTDVISIIGTVTQALTCAFQIVFLLHTRNFYVFLYVSIIFTVFNNIIISICADRMFPEVKCRGDISDDLKEKIKTNVAGLVIGKVSGTTRNTFDSIFMSMFLGLTQAAIYANYFYVLSALNGFTGIVSTSLLAGVGNSIAIESKETNFKQMMILHTSYLIISGWMAICMLCLYQPFMQLWVGKDFLFPGYVMVLFPIYFYISKLGDIRAVYADGAGLFWENRHRNILEGVANIILNYLFVKRWGAFGIVLATIITLFFFGFLGSTIVIFKHYFEHGMKEYLFTSLFYLSVTSGVGGIVYFAFSRIPIYSPLIALIVRAICCVTVIPAFYLLAISNRRDFKESYCWLKRVLFRSKQL